MKYLKNVNLDIVFNVPVVCVYEELTFWEIKVDLGISPEKLQPIRK